MIRQRFTNQKDHDNAFIVKLLAVKQNSAFFFEKLTELFKHGNPSVQIQILYVLSNIAYIKKRRSMLV